MHFFSTYLDVWPSLCRMMCVSMTLEGCLQIHLSTSLCSFAVNHSPIWRIHKCDVYTENGL